ncbi:MAG TPA: hypothetical protein VLT45_19815, partial [Kofleriaceae bacterium]|nr:hypothetical protein [Kofleriaceae bacterium]
TDSHPPAMAALWGILDRVVPGPTPMLLLQSGCFLAGTYLLLRRTLSPRGAAFAAVGILLYPPVLAPLVVIWKDCVMAGFFVLGIALMLREQRRLRIAGLALLCAGTAMRYNAPAATLPLVVLLFEWAPGMRWLRRTAIALAAWIAITAVAFGLDAALTSREMHFWESSFALQDMVGTLAMVDADLPDAELRPLLAPTQIHLDHDFHREIRTRYKRAEFTQLLVGPTALWSMPVAGTQPAPVEQRDAIDHAWWAIVSGHPGAFVRYRLETFGEMVGIYAHFNGTTVIRHRYQTPERLATMGIQSTQARWQEHAERDLLAIAKHTPLFRPHLYLIIAIIVGVFARRQRDVLALLASGVMMELTLLPLGATPDYRYSHWLVICTCLSLVIVVARRAAGGAIARASV